MGADGGYFPGSGGVNRDAEAAIGYGDNLTAENLIADLDYRVGRSANMLGYGYNQKLRDGR
jgi:hypothetical protein